MRKKKDRGHAPANIPAIKANELRIDNLFELADGTAAVVDYESNLPPVNANCT